MIILIYHKKNGRSQILFMELLVKKENFPKIPSVHERVKNEKVLKKCENHSVLESNLCCTILWEKKNEN